jgi:ABC-type bacteriocin/lantibiotic exporter with double-glycine peptidase domain
MQLQQSECGAACLAMILSYYGRPTSVAECREACGPGRDGLSAKAIATSARAYGLRAKAYSLGLAECRKLALPAIVHWSFNHFVVLEHLAPRHADIVDPAGGRKRVSTQEFSDGFTSIALTLEPGWNFKRQKGAKRALWRNYFGYMLAAPGVRPVLFQVLLASLFLQLIGRAPPALTKIVVDDILPYHLGNFMMIVGLGLLLLVFAQALTSYLRAALLIFLRARLDTRLMLGFFEHLLKLPFSYFQRRGTGDLLMRLGSNVNLREMLTSQSVSTILDAGMMLTYLVILLLIAPLYAAAALAVGVLQIATIAFTARPMHRLMQRGLETQAASQSYQVEALTGVAALKASGSEAQALDHWSDLFFKQLNVSLQRSHLSAITSTFLSGLRLLSPLLLLWIGATLVLNGHMSLGTMLALNVLATSFLTPLASLASTGQQLQLVGAQLERIADVLGAEPEQSTGSVKPAPELTGQIQLKNLSFCYDPNAPDVLQNISCTIGAGQKVAIVGRTGSGKSTLAMLLLGLYRPTGGEVLYDGTLLESLDYRSLRRQFGVVLQEPSLFSGSVRENIALNDPDLPWEKIIQAARLACIHDDIMNMPMGYETRISEGGSALSGGQRQRLALARALAHRPAILLLDEATSHLDTATESLVDGNLDTLGCTRIVIAHRLSTVQNADYILVLEEGKLMEQGPPAKLLRQGGHYASHGDFRWSSLVRQQRETPGDANPFGSFDLSAAGREEGQNHSKPEATTSRGEA